MKEIEAASLMAILAAAFPSAKISKETVSVYVAHLSDVPYEESRIAVDNLVRTSDFFPSVALLRREILAMMGLLAPPRESAWLEVETGMRTRGRGVKIDWSHPAISEAVRAMGWNNMCLSENLDVVRGQFFKVYDSLRDRSDRQAQTSSVSAIEAGDTRLIGGVVKSL